MTCADSGVAVKSITTKCINAALGSHIEASPNNPADSLPSYNEAVAGKGADVKDSNKWVSFANETIAPAVAKTVYPLNGLVPEDSLFPKPVQGHSIEVNSVDSILSLRHSSNSTMQTHAALKTVEDQLEITHAQAVYDSLSAMDKILKKKEKYSTPSKPPYYLCGSTACVADAVVVAALIPVAMFGFAGYPFLEAWFNKIISLPPVVQLLGPLTPKIPVVPATKSALLPVFWSLDCFCTLNADSGSNKPQITFLFKNLTQDPKVGVLWDDFLNQMPLDQISTKLNQSTLAPSLISALQKWGSLFVKALSNCSREEFAELLQVVVTFCKKRIGIVLEAILLLGMLDNFVQSLAEIKTALPTAMTRLRYEDNKDAVFVLKFLCFDLPEFIQKNKAALMKQPLTVYRFIHESSTFKLEE
ncbi:hypothetical protein BCR33DRAFT_742903 [Rhizoclosmatium globosum]|uniref:GST C-terminal domain-containing protein n=1 Tax=Rhizoclosmatium globosum TaxID=329046 RepID=A0A1Y2BMX5_9FUNG|nr:hypothetical protein BCR33DRAFT_742903 [Rhizoclosmatium globosum]|eukprot:ORY36109.1 hypothetical protein BCR33DRAFT_742903 [Rhizoclosmatium globosum]